MYLSVMLARIAQRTLDEEIRVKWFRGPVGRELASLVGMMESIPEGQNGQVGPTLELADTGLLRLLMEGRTNKEIAEEIGESEDLVVRRLGEMFARIGASSRAEATVFAFREKVV
jgi:DNA-binding CsgD family transcriptional regulator